MIQPTLIKEHQRLLKLVHGAAASKLLRIYLYAGRELFHLAVKEEPK